MKVFPSGPHNQKGEMSGPAAAATADTTACGSTAAAPNRPASAADPSSSAEPSCGEESRPITIQDDPMTSRSEVPPVGAAATATATAADTTADAQSGVKANEDATTKAATAASKDGTSEDGDAVLRVLWLQERNDCLDDIYMRFERHCSAKPPPLEPAGRGGADAALRAVLEGLSTSGAIKGAMDGMLWE
eukprot:GHVU01097244.1.p2 GENE.GHVU01097244.1~~GHVU01097244.1.p2  ORF type:complete len:190 (+),score=38.51 GHVU01097244.1:345-914(+)